MEKTCNFDCYCKYRVLGGSLVECNFNGYCDFQAPRDSRGKSIENYKDEIVALDDRLEGKNNV